MAVYGWKDSNGNKYFTGQNSWRYTFGNGGRFLYNMEYPVQESWAEEDDIKEESEDMTYAEFRGNLPRNRSEAPGDYEESIKARQVMEF